MNKVVVQLNSLFRTGFFHIFGSTTINKIITFLSSILLVRILSKADYGLFTYAWNIYSLVFLFNGMGIESGTLQLASEHSADKDYVNNVSGYGIRFGIKFNIILVFSLILISLVFPLKFESAKSILFGLSFLPIIQIVYGIIAINLRAKKMNKEYSMYLLTNTILLLLFSCLLSLLLKVNGLVLAYYISFSLSVILGIKFYNFRFTLKKDYSLGLDRDPLLKISLISMINNGLSQLLYLLDIFVLGLIDPEETILASYKVATMIPTALTFIPFAIMTYLYPYFAQHQNDKEWCLRTYRKVLRSAGAFNLIISLVLILLAPIIIKYIFGVEYIDCIPVFRLLSLNYFFSGTFRIISGNLLVTQRKLVFNLFVAILSSSVNIVADYLFIQWWGSMGAAIATMLVVLLSSTLSTIYLFYTFNHIATD